MKIIYIEGAVIEVKINRYERKISARQDCIKKYGYNCSICEIKLSDIYGEIARDFIHVHHLIPLSEIKEEYKINPVEDLRPVCPNCHAILHLRKPTLTIDELRTLIKVQKEKK